MRPGVACAVAVVIVAPVCVRAALGPAYGGEVTVAVPTLPDSLDPARPTDAAHRLALRLVHETLIQLGDDNRPAPGLARAWSRFAGDREWVFELDPDARFHDDRPVTAEDALRSLRRFLDARSPAAVALAALLAQEGLSAADGRHLAMRFREPQPDAPLLLASSAAAITSPSGAGAGPFLPTYRVPGQRLALTSFAGHVRGRPYLDRVTLSLVADEARRAAGVAAGSIDAALDAGPSRWEAPRATLVLVLDSKRPPLDAPTARAAIAAAVRAADIPAFLPGAGSLRGAPGMTSVAPLRAPLTLAVAADVPALASQRIAAVLESTGAHVSVEPRSPQAARDTAAPLRLLLDVPETPFAAGQPSSPAGVEGTIIPIASLPLRLATSVRIHGARIGADGAARLEDGWVDP